MDRSLIRDVATTVLEIAGAAAVTSGVFLWLGAAAALIVGGVLVAAGAFLASAGGDE